LFYESNQLFLSRPRILIITDSKGKKVDSHVVDLAAKNADGEYLYSIIKTMDPGKYKINLAEYLL